MKVIATGLTAFVLICALITGFFTQKEANTAIKEYQFNYYPEVNVYYDYNQSNLLYTLDGGKSWIKVPRSKDSLPASLGRPITFQSPVAEGWLQNPLHRAQYSGVHTDFTINPAPVYVMDTLASDREKQNTLKSQENTADKKKARKKQEGKKGKNMWLKDLKERIKSIGAKFKKDK